MAMVMDTLRGWRSIYAALPDFDIKRQNSIKNLHDYIAKEQLKVGTMNIEISYSESELRWNGTHDGITFTLAKQTHDLIDVGNDLRICVGGYADGAVRKIFNIVVGYKDGKPIVCMEIRNGRLAQAKMLNNTRAAANDWVCGAVKSFCRANRIEFNDCYDVTKHRENTFNGMDMVQNIPAPRPIPVPAFIMEEVAYDGPRTYPF